MHMNSGRDAQQSWLAVRWDKKGLFAGFFAAYLSRSTPKNITPVYAIYFYIPRHLLVGSRYIRLLFSVLFKNFNGMPRLFIKTLLRINRDCDWNFDSILLVAYKFTHRTSCNLWQMPTFCCTRILMTPFSTDFYWHETPKSLMVHFHVPGEFPSARFFLFSSAACKRRH